MRVARAFAQDPHAVAAAPFARTAWALLELLDAERLDGLVRQSEQLHAASLTALAFHAPKQLGEERRALLARARARAPRTVGSTADAVRRGRALAERVARGRVLEDTPRNPPSTSEH